MTSSSFSEIYLPLKDNLYRTAYYILESGDAAEDAVQELYLKLWRMRDDLGSINNPKSYCITLIRNICLDILRQRGRSSPESIEGRDFGGSFQQDDRLDSKQRLELVRKAMDSLTKTEAMILRMRVFEDLEYDEISRRTGISALSLRVQLSTARKKIKKQLNRI